MRTKQRIINKAIEYYNREGLTNITSRDLAKSLNISHGNLDYHFENKEALLMAIYKRMKKDISEFYKERDAFTDPFEHFNELLTSLEKFHRTYSFFNLDVLEISRKYPKVNELLKKTFHVRKEQMAHFYDHFKAFGYFEQETQPGMYMRLQRTIRIVITFWNSQKEVLPYFGPDQKDSMSLYIWELLIPHMTEKGKEVYKDMKSNQMSLK